MLEMTQSQSATAALGGHPAGRFACALTRDQLLSLQDLTAALSKAPTTDDVADAIVTHGLAALDADVGVVARLTGDGSQFVMLRTAGYADHVLRPGLDFGRDAPVMIADAVRTGDLVFCSTLEERHRRYPRIAHIQSIGGDSTEVALPLMLGSRPVGGISLCFHEPRPLNKGEWTFLRALAMPCAQALDRANLFDASQQEIAERREVERRLARRMLQLQESNFRLQQQTANLQAANAQLELLATLDSLTGLKNLRAFRSHLDTECERTRRYDTPLSLVLLDVDHFKEYNDTFGHPAGDEVLQALSQLLQASARRSDFVARYGGEEFAILLPHTPAEESCAIAERLRQSIAAHPWARRPVTASLGMATGVPFHIDAAALISEADRALYCSKAEGRNRVTHFRELYPGP